MKIRVAGLTVGIETDGLPDYPYRDYLTEGDADFTVSPGKKEIEEERRRAAEATSDAMLAHLATYRAMAEKLPDYDAFVFHSAVVEYRGQAVAFAAQSGVGKSTHIRYWREAFGGDCKIVNGDKPIIRVIDGRLYACGTPWCGKEGWQRPVNVPLAAICFLTRDVRPSAIPVTVAEAAPIAIGQTLFPDDPEAAAKTLALLDGMLSRVRLYEVRANMSTEAAKAAKTIVFGGEI